MNAVLTYFRDRNAYVDANAPALAIRMAHEPAHRSDALAALGNDLAVTLALSLNDDAELGRVIRAGFLREMQEIATAQAEYDFDKTQEDA